MRIQFGLILVVATLLMGFQNCERNYSPKQGADSSAPKAIEYAAGGSVKSPAAE